MLIICLIYIKKCMILYNLTACTVIKVIYNFAFETSIITGKKINQDNVQKVSVKIFSNFNIFLGLSLKEL